MSKKLGLESKYKQFINPTKLGEYKAVMGKGPSYTPTAKTFELRKKALSTASSVLKRSPVGRIVTAIGKAVTSKPGMFGAGIGIGANVKKDNKKMGGGMMRYSQGSKDTVSAYERAKKITEAYKRERDREPSKRITAKDLKIQELKTGKAVKLSPKQKKIAAMAGNPNKIDAPDFDKLRMTKAKTGKMMKAALGVLAMKKASDKVSKESGMPKGLGLGIGMSAIKAKKMKEILGAKTGKEAKISKVMKEYKEGKLNIGKSKKKVKNKKQAIAIALSEARKKNA